MFTAIGEFFIGAWNRVVGVFETINVFSSLLDVVLLALLFYAVLRLVRDSRAEQLLKGLLFLFVGYLVAILLDLKAVSYVLQLLFGNALILLVVVFQPELRRILERMGHSRIRFNPLNAQEEATLNTTKAIDGVCDAVENLQNKRMGALIVFERKTMLGDVAATGTMLDADCSAELIGNLFFNKAPLHDGAVILREGRVLSAGCILPLTDNLALSSELGTRHRGRYQRKLRRGGAGGFGRNRRAVAGGRGYASPRLHGGVAESGAGSPPAPARRRSRRLRQTFQEDQKHRKRRKQTWLKRKTVAVFPSPS